VDEGGSGRLTYGEVYEMCAHNFEKFVNVKEDSFMIALTEFFASVIFRVSYVLIP